MGGQFFAYRHPRRDTVSWLKCRCIVSMATIMAVQAETARRAVPKVAYDPALLALGLPSAAFTLLAAALAITAGRRSRT